LKRKQKPQSLKKELKKASNTSTGNLGEDQAVDFLIKKGYKILDRNFRSKFGELDIIAKKRGIIYFVEVKARSSLRYGHPNEVVGKIKLARLKKTVHYFVLLNELQNYPLRMKVVAIDWASSKIEILDVY